MLSDVENGCGRTQRITRPRPKSETKKSRCDIEHLLHCHAHMLYTMLFTHVIQLHIHHWRKTSTRTAKIATAVALLRCGPAFGSV